MTDTLQSRTYKPNPDKACERCCFGTGQHAPFCPFGGDRAAVIKWFTGRLDRGMEQLREYIEETGRPDAV